MPRLRLTSCPRKRTIWSWAICSAILCGNAEPDHGFSSSAIPEATTSRGATGTRNPLLTVSPSTMAVSRHVSELGTSSRRTVRNSFLTSTSDTRLRPPLRKRPAGRWRDVWPYWDESDQGGTRFADKSACFLPLEKSFGRERDVGDCQPCHRPGAHALQHYKPLPPWAPRGCWSAVKTRRRARLPAERTNIRFPAGFAPNQARTRVTVAHFTRDANPAGGTHTDTDRLVATSSEDARETIGARRAPGRVAGMELRRRSPQAA